MEKQLPHFAWFFLGLIICSTTRVEAEVAETAIAVETSELIFDGKPIGQLQAGTSVEVIGEKKDQGLTLIRFSSANGEQTMGLVRTSCLIESKQPAAPAGASKREPEAQIATTPSSFDLDKQLAAPELAEYLEQNRAQFPELAGKLVKVDGVVEEIRVLGKVGSMLTAEITLKTRPDLPKVRLLVHASEFMEDAKGDRFEMRVQGKTLEGRSRDTRYPYNYWYWYNGYWRSRSVARSEWVPIISVGHPVNGTGILGKYHIHIELDGAKINKS
jgi:hypothetical protein